MAFSLISIIITVISINITKKLLQSQDSFIIEFDVKESMIIDNIKFCKNNVRKIKIQIGSILGVSENIIEITRPTAIINYNGLRVHCIVYISNTKAIDINFERLICDAVDSKQLPLFIQRMWRLEGEPINGKAAEFCNYFIKYI